jgi:hypothetical protein
MKKATKRISYNAQRKTKQLTDYNTEQKQKDQR